MVKLSVVALFFIHETDNNATPPLGTSLLFGNQWWQGFESKPTSGAHIDWAPVAEMGASDRLISAHRAMSRREQLCV
jgi:hypothetical protein